MPNPCVLVPFFNRLDQVVACVTALLPQLGKDACVCLVDDGSLPRAQSDPGIQQLLQHGQVHLIEHDSNHGVAAARNTGLHWCRERQVGLVIMIDSDCTPPPDFIATHIALHEQYPDAACVGGGIVGTGKGFWAKLDGILSWVHAVPHGAVRPVLSPYHLPTTNFSVKLSQLPARDFIFDERLQTGEDCFLIRELRAAGKGVYFSPQPQVTHRDREALQAVLQHHYRWGYHQYFLQLGRDFSMPVFALWYRLLFMLVFIPLVPFFALACSGLNLLPWLRYRPGYLLYWPLAYVVWLGKSVAILQAAWTPATVLRASRTRMVYHDVVFAVV